MSREQQEYVLLHLATVKGQLHELEVRQALTKAKLLELRARHEAGETLTIVAAAENTRTAAIILHAELELLTQMARILTEFPGISPADNPPPRQTGTPG